MSQDFPLDKNINLPAIGTSPGPDTMATTGQPRRSFLDLPAEIRFGVYQKLFTGAKLEVFETACGQNVRRAAGFEHHILLTCRQVRTEALPLLQSETTISYFCYGWNDTIPTHYLSGIKVLSITATCLTGYDWELSIAAHLDELPALKIMHVESCDLTYEGHTELTAEVQLISSPEYDPELLQEINRWVALDKDILAQVIDLPKRSFIVVLHAVFAVELFELTFRNLVRYSYPLNIVPPVLC